MKYRLPPSRGRPDADIAEMARLGDYSSDLRMIATNVLILRATARLSQQALADKAGLSRVAVSEIERATSTNPSYGTLYRIAAALDACVTDLLAPFQQGEPTTEEIRQRALDPDSQFVNAEALQEAISNGQIRYSPAGRPRSKKSHL
jgi:transcriptional regulator with XRE-family HTH domain